ncbi:MAG: sensor histidine kinase [Bdellovibrionia bacterium]
MSAGIAHEINNPLTVIQARSFQLTQLAELNKLDPEKVIQIAESVSKTADKIARIVKSLRTFARDGSKDPFHLVSVKDLIENTLEFCRTRFYNAGIELKVCDISEEIEVECRTIEIEQVLLNLLNNSFDAIQECSDKWIAIDVINHDNFVDIIVSDSGGPIPKEIADKIMLPFFTTKEVGKGTGLGLSISTGIMKNHQGNLIFNRNEPHTCFTMRLPHLQTAL